jgi:hypothetical protein
MRVLGITEDSGFLRPLRMDMPLLNLKKQGLIEGYFVTNPTLFDVPDDQFFDVVWLQRVRFGQLISHLSERLADGYLYDIDDFMIGEPSYLSREELHPQTVIEALKNCKVLTAPSERLVRLLERASEINLASKNVLCPNGLEFPLEGRTPCQPQGLLLTQSDRLALFPSREDFLRAVFEFAGRYNLPLYYVGSPKDVGDSWSPSLVCLGRVPFWHYCSLLASLPPMIGLAPLETQGDPATINFICGKSDIKMVNYGGFGHPSVYSNAEPYTDTDLNAGVVVDNTYESWMNALEETYSKGWQRIHLDQRDVVAKRNMDRIAKENWCEALEAARLSKPISGKDIKYRSGTISYYLGAVRHVILSQDHASRRRLQENMPEFAVKILRRFLLRI